MRMTAARTLVTGAAAPRLYTAEFAKATVRAASKGSANTSLMARSIWQSGSDKANCNCKAALTLVGKVNSPRTAWETINPNACNLFIIRSVRLCFYSHYLFSNAVISHYLITETFISGRTQE